MTPDNFVFWLQGFVELDGRLPNDYQWNQIKEHLQLSFTHMTGLKGDEDTKEPNDYRGGNADDSIFPEIPKPVSMEKVYEIIRELNEKGQKSLEKSGGLIADNKTPRKIC
jgi:hypothetical protein